MREFNIAIVTPTFNRASRLEGLYDSLLEQDFKGKFQWIIIDDGGNDNTKNLVESKFKKRINTLYRYKENSGKSSSLNYAFEEFNEIDIMVIVDSDDLLLPTAISDIYKSALKYYDNENIGAMFFYYIDNMGKNIKVDGKVLAEDVVLDRYEYNRSFKQNDGCVVYFNKVFKKYRYPEFEHENYVAPTVIQMLFSEKYKIAFVNKAVGIAEYQEGGLTKSGRKLRIKNPKGMKLYSQLMLDDKNPFIIRFKNAIGYVAYSFFSKNHSLKNVPNKSKILVIIGYIPGYFLYKIWKKQDV